MRVAHHRAVDRHLVTELDVSAVVEDQHHLTTLIAGHADGIADDEIGRRVLALEAPVHEGSETALFDVIKRTVQPHGDRLRREVDVPDDRMLAPLIGLEQRRDVARVRKRPPCIRRE